MKCDICEYEHKTVVWKDIDGIMRCKVCRDMIRYGEYDRDDKGDKEFTDVWLEILREYQEKEKV